jgi:tetratricopeptide (TPR) repeat protein
MEESLALLGEALGSKPGDPAMNYDMAIIHTRRGRDAEALPHFEKALVHPSLAAEAGFNLGAALQRLGRAGEAAERYQEALRARPSFPEAWYNLGTAQRGLGLHAEAAASFREAIRLRPGHANSHNNLGLCLEALGEGAAATAAYRDALAADPSHAEALNNLGARMTQEDRSGESLDLFEKAVRLRPGFAAAENNWGTALQRLGRIDDALVHYGRAIALVPRFAEAQNNLGAALAFLGRHEEAAARYGHAIAVRDDFPEAHNNLGNALRELGRAQDAMASFERAIALRPAYAEAHNNRGNLLVELGEIDAGIREFEEAIWRDPARTAYYRSLTNFKRIETGDPVVAKMEALLGETGGGREEDRMDLHFALGKAFEDLGQDERSFRHLVQGNALKRRRIAYDEERALGGLARLREAFSRELMERLADCGHTSAAPVFIVGMPRSGTSLIEQILASHPDAHGAGELMELENAVAAEFGGIEALSGAALLRDPPALRRIGERYAAAVSGLSDGRAVIVDKQPLNFRLTGLIHLALPNARIIHSRRDPVDTCVSCFSKLFTAGIDFAYDLAELGRYYSGYSALMEHWRSVVPKGVILDVVYEELVGGVEAESRRILAHCGLGWNDACATFWSTQRRVRTASAAQVRKPLFTSSIGRSRRLGEQLDPLLRELHP